MHTYYTYMEPLIPRSSAYPKFTSKANGCLKLLEQLNTVIYFMRSSQKNLLKTFAATKSKTVQLFGYRPSKTKLHCRLHWWTSMMPSNQNHLRSVSIEYFQLMKLATCLSVYLKRYHLASTNAIAGVNATKNAWIVLCKSHTNSASRQLSYRIFQFHRPWAK